MKIESKKSGRPLWEGHRARLRQRMEREGWEALRPFEMLELVLYYAVPRQDISDVSRLLVDRFGTVGGVFGASREQLLAAPGMTESLAEWIELTGELMRAYRDMYGNSVVRLSCYQEVLDFLKPRMNDRREAGLWALYADYNFNLITFSELGRTASWWDAENTRQMMLDAIGNGTRYIYLVIFTDEAPGALDEEEIARLEAICDTLRAVELELVDCLLVGGEEVFSMNIHGKMDYIRSSSGCKALHERYGGSDFD